MTLEEPADNQGERLEEAGELPGQYGPIAEHLRYWRRRLLPEWDVYLMADSGNAANRLDAEDPEALSHTPSPYNALTLWISPGLVERTVAGDEAWAYLEQVIVHEYLHALVDQAHEATEALEQMVGAIAWQYRQRAQAIADERLIDRLARALVAERRHEQGGEEPRRGGFMLGNDWRI